MELNEQLIQHFRTLKTIFFLQVISIGNSTANIQLNVSSPHFEGELDHNAIICIDENFKSISKIWFTSYVSLQFVDVSFKHLIFNF